MLLVHHEDLIISHGGGRDTGIYNMLDGSIEPHYLDESLSCITPPMWFFPSFLNDLLQRRIEYLIEFALISILFFL